MVGPKADLSGALYDFVGFCSTLQAIRQNVLLVQFVEFILWSGSVDVAYV